MYRIPSEPDLAEKLDSAFAKLSLALAALAAVHREPSGNPGELPRGRAEPDDTTQRAEAPGATGAANAGGNREPSPEPMPPRPCPPMRLVTKGLWVYSEARVAANQIADREYASHYGWFRRLRRRIAVAWAWDEVMQTRGHIYEENLITGDRRATARTPFGRLVQPNTIWLNGGPPPRGWVNDGWSDAPGMGPIGPPPTTGSGVRAPGS